jgi:HEAT repeat protein
MTNTSGDEPSLPQPETTSVQLGGERAILHLVEVLNQPDETSDWRIQNRVVEQLEIIGNERAVEILVGLLLRPEYEYMQARVVRALSHLGGDTALSALLSVPQSAGFTAQREIARALAAWPDVPDVLERLFTLLGHESREVSREAGWSLAQAQIAQSQDTAITQRLLTCLRSKDPYLRHGAAVACGKLALPEAIPLLIGLLDASFWFVRIEAARALGQPRLTEALDALTNRLHDEVDEVRMVAADSLGVIGDQRAIRPLMMRLTETEASPEAREYAKALAHIGGANARRSLTRIAESHDLHENIRDAAYYGLGQLSDERVIPTLAAGIDDESEFIQAGAIMAFWQIRTSGAVSLLAEALGKSEWTDEHIIGALKVIGTAEALEALAAWEASHRGGEV